MDSRIIHEYDNWSSTKDWIWSDMKHDLIDEVLKNWWIDSSFNQLISNNAFLWYCRDQTYRVVLHLDLVLSLWNFVSKHSFFSQWFFESLLNILNSIAF